MLLFILMTSPKINKSDTLNFLYTLTTISYNSYYAFSLLRLYTIRLNKMSENTYIHMHMPRSCGCPILLNAINSVDIETLLYIENPALS